MCFTYTSRWKQPREGHAHTSGRRRCSPSFLPSPTTVQGYTLSGRSETSYNPLSFQQPPARLRSHLSTFHSMKEKPWCQPTMYLVTSHDRHCKPPERGAAAWTALGTPWCLEEISPHQGCIPSPTPHWVHKHLLMKLMELNLLTPQASFLRPERQYLLGSCLPSCFTAAGIRPGMGRRLL